MSKRTNSARHFYFNRIPRLWNSLPTFDLDQSVSSIKRGVQQFFWDHFIHTLNLIVHVHITSCVLALNVHVYL